MGKEKLLFFILVITLFMFSSQKTSTSVMAREVVGGGEAASVDATIQGDEVQVHTTVEAAKVGFKAPSVVLYGLDKRKYVIGGKRNKPLLINFWASWCGPCQIEAPTLKQLFEKYGDQIDFYAINVTADDRMQQVTQFVKAQKWTLPVLLDLQGKAADLYRIRGIPVTFLIDQSGTISDAFYFSSYEDMEIKIKKHLQIGVNG